jgi:transposase, IS5 family
MEDVLPLLNFISRIHERAYRNRPWSEEQQATNREQSQTRAKVEHVFGAWVMQMGGKLLRSIGLERAKVNIGLKNLTYNFMRLVFWETRPVAE